MKYKDIKCKHMNCTECPLYHKHLKSGLLMPNIKDYICLSGRRNDTLQETFDKFQQTHPNYEFNLMGIVKLLNKRVPDAVLEKINYRIRERISDL